MTGTASRHLITGLLALVAGLSDCLGWLLLKGAFTAHITGNLVVAAADGARGQAPALGPLLAIPAFILVTAAATLLAVRTSRALVLQRSLLGAQTVLLMVAAVCAVSRPGAATTVILLLVVCAMAVQNALLHLLIAPAPATAVMTGNVVVATVALVRLLTAKADKSTAVAAFAGSWPLIAGFTAGCLISATVGTAVRDSAWFLPAAVSAALTVWLWTRTAEGAGQGRRRSS